MNCRKWLCLDRNLLVSNDLIFKTISVLRQNFISNWLVWFLTEFTCWWVLDLTRDLENLYFTKINGLHSIGFFIHLIIISRKIRNRADQVSFFLILCIIKRLQHSIAVCRDHKRKFHASNERAKFISHTQKDRTFCSASLWSILNYPKTTIPLQVNRKTKWLPLSYKSR